jgi:hypothetical protein
MIRVFYDETSDQILISGEKRPFPLRSLEMVAMPNSKVLIKLSNANVPIIGPVPWTLIRDESGSSFTTQEELTDYIDSIFLRNPVAPPPVTDLTTDISYNDDGGVETITKQSGETKSFSYNVSGDLESMTITKDGDSVTYFAIYIENRFAGWDTL